MAESSKVQTPSIFVPSKLYSPSLSLIIDKGGITVHCVHPGSVRTDMSSGKGSLSPDQGAETPVMVALLPLGSCETGSFWFNKEVVSW